MSNIEPWRGSRVAQRDWRSRAIVRATEQEVLAEQGRAIEAATRIRCTTTLGDELMTAVDQLRRHEARSAAEDPVIADEYAAIRRAVLHCGIGEIERYGQRPWT